MPPTSDGENVRTVACALAKLIPNPVHLHQIRDAVATTHKATILASELLNMHIRRTLDDDPAADRSQLLLQRQLAVSDIRSPSLCGKKNEC